jgi:hypothetical protein
MVQLGKGGGSEVVDRRGFRDRGHRADGVESTLLRRVVLGNRRERCCSVVSLLLVLGTTSMAGADGALRLYVGVRETPELAFDAETLARLQDEVTKEYQAAQTAYDEILKSNRSKHGSPSKWPEQARTELADAEAQLVRIRHRVHLNDLSAEASEELRGFVDRFIRRPFETKDYVGFGKVQSPLVVVDDPSQADLVVEVQNRFHDEDGRTGVCFRLSPAESVSARFEGPEKLGLRNVTLVAENGDEPPPWVVHVVETTAGVSYWREAGAAAIKLVDAFVEANASAFGLDSSPP